VHVRRVGDRDAQDVAVDLERDGADALEHVQRNFLRCVHLDAGLGEIDERQLVAGGQRARDPFLGRDPFVDERLRERSGGTGATARESELVVRDQPGGREQVSQQLRARVDLGNLAAAEPTAFNGRLSRCLRLARSEG